MKRCRLFREKNRDVSTRIIPCTVSFGMCRRSCIRPHRTSLYEFEETARASCAVLRTKHESSDIIARESFAMRPSMGRAFGIKTWLFGAHI